MKKINGISILIGVVVVLAACGPTPNTVAPVEEWPAIGTAEAAESTRVALVPTVAVVGHLDVTITARNARHAMGQMVDALADSTGYETVQIVVESGGAVVLTAVYEHSRTGSIVWGGDWTPNVYTMQGAATAWAGDTSFWGGQ